MRLHRDLRWHGRVSAPKRAGEVMSAPDDKKGGRVFFGGLIIFGTIGFGAWALGYYVHWTAGVVALVVVALALLLSLHVSGDL